MRIGPVFLILLLFTSTSQGAVLYSDDFDGYTDSPANHGWSMGSSVSVVSSGCRSGRCVKVAYTVEGTSQYAFERSISTPDIWVRFHFKLSNHANPGGGGNKFLKLFGSRSGTNYANTTIQTNYASGVLGGVSCGDGNGLTNDTQAFYDFNGNLSNAGIPGSPTVYSHLGPYNMPALQDVWHSFEAHVKFNTDGNYDGEFQVWIDESDWYHVTGVKNRNDGNVRNFISLALGDYGRGGSYDLYYDDVAYGTSYVGPAGSPPPQTKIPNTPVIVSISPN